MFELMELPFLREGLEPYMSRETIDYHYGQHHAAYVKKLNELIQETPYAKNADLDEIVRKSTGALFNNAAQVWNHNFFWHCLTPDSKGYPEKALGNAIDETFGSFKQFKEEFKNKAVGLFGSGWVWLVADGEGKLSIVQTRNAENPIVAGYRPLLVCDVWEHAYYIDKRNLRGAYVDDFWNLVNWDFVAQKFAEK